MVDYEDPRTWDEKTRNDLEICAMLKLGDFADPAGHPPKPFWAKNYEDKLHEADRTNLDFQGWDDEEDNQRKGRR